MVFRAPPRTRSFYRSEAVKKIAETQGEGGRTALDFLRQEEKNAPRRRQEGLKLGGLISVVVGIAMMIFIQGGEHNSPEPGYLVGLLPLFIGRLLSYSYLLAPKN